MGYFDAADLEEIKKLKARYFRFVDTQQWDAWGDLFTEDATLRLGPTLVLNGRAEVVGRISKWMAGIESVHHGHMPEIEFIDENNARGVWAMFDLVEGNGRRLNGYGHYHEEYRREADGKWRIAKLTLTRLREDVVVKEKELLRAVP